MSETYQARNGKLEKLQLGGIPCSGARGALDGYETATVLSGSQTITANSPDNQVVKTSGATTLTFTPAAEDVWCVKGVCLKATAATTLTVAGASWASGADAPTWGDAGKTLMLATLFAGGQVVLNVIHNDQ